MIAARKFISDLLFIKYLVLRWEINIRKGERDQTRVKKQQERRDEMLQGCLEGDGAQRESASGPISPGTEGKGLHGARMALPAPSQHPPVDARTQSQDCPPKCLGVFGASGAPHAPSPKTHTTSPSTTSGLCPGSPSSPSSLCIDPKPPLTPLSPQSPSTCCHVWDFESRGDSHLRYSRIPQHERRR